MYPCRYLFLLLRIKLNGDQEEILEFASQGHNLFITGQGGVGKSEVVKRIVQSLKARGKTVGVICSSGIACQVYDRGLASTVHSFYGLSTAELPWRQLIERSVGNSLIRDRLKALDVVIWGEASMSSRRMFEVVNFLHHKPFTFPSDLFDGPVQQCFEDEEVAAPLELLDVYDRMMRHQSSLASPPEGFLIKSRDHLLALKASPTSIASPFLEEKYRTIDFLLTDTCWLKVQCLVELIWFHSFLIIENHIVENPDEIVVNIGRQGFTEATSRLHEFLTSTEFSRYVCIVFAVKETTISQRTVVVEIAKFIYFEFLETLASIVRHDRMIGVAFNVQEMDVVGRSKVRHVGGWAVRKVLSRARTYLRKNVYTTSSSTLVKVETKQRACEVLEENVIQSFDRLQETSKFKETLEVTEARQYRQRGLLHISDEAYLFFMQLEQRRVDLLNVNVMRKERENMVEAAICRLSSDEELKESWMRCFQSEEVDRSEVCNICLISTMGYKMLHLTSTAYCLLSDRLL